ncbi:MAG TPA: cyanophycinase [Amaricoccus sp.]|uniref:cyanophycinase n=3 Tax=Amaricoccus TaxID=56999 RepID=UPI002C539CB3|nr:cyanophycinase [Amaricoccus sp.]HRO12473.1 cyanophycinase [Amaricoccus sp.]
MADQPASLALIGGRLEDSNIAIYGEMHRLSGGRILVFPTASAEPKAVGQETLAVFRTHGFDADVIPLTPANARRLAHDPTLIARVADVGSIYFTGGDQAKITASLAGTPLLAAIRALPGLVAGSSAGAAIMSDPMILGGTSIEAVVHGVTDDPETQGLLLGAGLGFFAHGMVDQHFIKRGRLGRLVVAMARAGVRRGFGIDENTALLVEGTTARVCGEYGVMLVDMRHRGGLGAFRLSYLDDGDGLDLARFRPQPGAAKRRVRKREIAYRAPARSRRNVFGAYTLYDLMARLVLGDPASYTRDQAEAFDARSGINVTVELERQPRRSKGLIATPESGLRMSALDFRCSITREHLSATRLADRIGSRARTFGMTPNPEARIVLLGSSPLTAAPAMLEAPIALLGAGPVGVLAAASADPARTAAEHLALLARHGVHAIDLGVTIDNLDYVEQNHDLLEDIAGLRGILFCGGNQIRLVETLLHRGEESAVLRAIARAHAQGAVLIAASGAASALSGVMIAGGSSWEALRYGVSSDTGHRGLVIQEGIGLFSGGIVDQNLISGNRLGRLVVACAEESERFGIGVFEDSAVVASHAGSRLQATGARGFLLVEVDVTALELQSDSFVARGVRLTVLGPGDTADLATGAVTREAPAEAAAALLARLVADLAREVGTTRGASHGLRAQPHDLEGATAFLDLEFPRDESD